MIRPSSRPVDEIATIAAGEFTPHYAYGTNNQGLWLRDVDVVEDGGVLQLWFVKTGVMDMKLDS